MIREKLEGPAFSSRGLDFFFLLGGVRAGDSKLVEALSLVFVFVEMRFSFLQRFLDASRVCSGFRRFCLLGDVFVLSIWPCRRALLGGLKTTYL